MIADWTVDVGPGSPSIDVPWPGWVDLRSRPELAAGLPEAALYPELLPMLHQAALLTSKVDVFVVTRDEVDPELAEGEPDEGTAHGLGSYLDCLCGLLPFDAAERTARAAVQQLRTVPLARAVVEIVIRPARLYDGETFGWTLYAIGFGPSEYEARRRWSEAARAALDALEHAGRTNTGE